jgi:hypothetical protein
MISKRILSPNHCHVLSFSWFKNVVRVGLEKEIRVHKLISGVQFII